jgi:cytochrome c553
MKRLLLMLPMLFFVPLTAGTAVAGQVPVSSATEECLECHAIFHPGIVEDWRRSRHAAMTPKSAMAVKGLQSKLSSAKVPEDLKTTSVGCAECHTLRGDKHADTFEHNGYHVHVVVSPDDCATCHATERAQYAKNIMAMAEKNLSENTLYADLQRTILGKARQKKGHLTFSPANALTRADACYYCHGTRLSVTGTETRDTDAGELDFPVIAGWPNQGVGRINLDGSRGACSACHTRHRFSMEMARKPFTCKECHVGPDVPAFKVYSASKHGNIFSAMGSQWNYTHVPWVIGEDIQGPTCATCHISLTVNTDGEVVNQRTHQMSDRLGWRIFGLIYAHPQPKSPDTTIIRNKAGLQLPADLDGTPAAHYLISSKEISRRRGTMQQTCLGCHDSSWVRGYFQRLDNTIATSNASVKVATRMMTDIWKKGYARDSAAGGSLFDEYIERRWCDAWLLYGNNIRFVSAMAGGGDYGVFEDGRYHLTKTLMEMEDWIGTQNRLNGK